MTVMPHREYKKLNDDDFVVEQEVTGIPLHFQMSTDLHVMSIASMTDTPTGHHCLTYTDTLTTICCVVLDPFDMTPDPLKLENKI